MIRTLEISADSFALSRPFRISRGVKSAAEVVSVSLTQDGTTGRGEGVPYPRYGESVTLAIAEIEAVRGALESGAGREDLLALMRPGAARNAVDCALWDLEMRFAGEQIFPALGIENPKQMATAMTVGLDAPAAMGEAARKLAEAPLIKVKVDNSDPEAQLLAVRAAAPRPQLIVDPNESWGIEEVAGLQELLQRLKVDLLEQPLPAGEDSALDGFVSAIPIAADESLHGADDLAGLPSGYGVANIKLDKAGGLTAALQLGEAARARGLGLMAGCMICSSLSIAPAMVIGAMSRFVDLDGPEWLKADRPGGVGFAGGYLSAPQPGFWGGA